MNLPGIVWPLLVGGLVLAFGLPLLVSGLAPTHQKKTSFFLLVGGFVLFGLVGVGGLLVSGSLSSTGATPWVLLSCSVLGCALLVRLDRISPEAARGCLFLATGAAFFGFLTLSSGGRVQSSLSWELGGAWLLFVGMGASCTAASLGWSLRLDKTPSITGNHRLRLLMSLAAALYTLAMFLQLMAGWKKTPLQLLTLGMVMLAVGSVVLPLQAAQKQEGTQEWRVRWRTVGFLLVWWQSAVAGGGLFLQLLLGTS